MSVENVKAFNQRLLDDSAVSERFATLAESGPDAVVSYAGELGLSFTKDELLAVAGEMNDKLNASGELSEEQLEAVAGGFFGPIYEVTKRVTAPLVPLGWLVTNEVVKNM